jgi:RNA polymerase sigma-70 factor (ECF subfamily)
LEELYTLFHRRLAAFLTRLTQRYDLAEDIINDTFWVVWCDARDFRNGAPPSTWILGIAYRAASQAFRSSPRVRSQERFENQAPPAPIAGSQPLQTEELQHPLAQALVQLPIAERCAVELCYRMGQSCENIATIMSCTVDRVKRRLYEARAHPTRCATSVGARLEPNHGVRPKHRGQGPAALIH